MKSLRPKLGISEEISKKSASPRPLSRRTGRGLLGFVVLSAALLPAVGVASSSSPQKTSRYPYDPACAWGRLSNGKGMFHRCLEEGEARQLAEAASAKTRDSAAKKDDPKSTTKDSKDSDKNGTADVKARPLPKDYTLTVGPIAADEGDLEVGRLSLPVDRYRQCIDENGGLGAASASVVVKFLVRAETVRAEGVSVDSFDKVSKAAAECIASVVDRRQVGVPTVPLTAARLTFQMREKP